MTATKPSANDRLVAAPAAIKRCEQKIDAVMERRRTILREHDANALVAIQIDRELGALKLLRQRLIDQQTELGRGSMAVPSVAPERSGWTWPSTLEDATAQLLAVEPQIARMRAVKPVDRSAAFDAALDSLVNRQYRLLRLVELFAPKSMVAS